MYFSYPNNDKRKSRLQNFSINNDIRNHKLYMFLLIMTIEITGSTFFP